MPDATEETISQLEQNISKLSSITTMMSEGKTPEDILSIVLDGLNPRILDEIEVGFECECSKERVKKVLIDIGKYELQAIIDEQQEAEIGCQFCSSKYKYTEEELREILNEM